MFTDLNDSLIQQSKQSEECYWLLFKKRLIVDHGKDERLAELVNFSKAASREVANYREMSKRRKAYGC